MIFNTLSTIILNKYQILGSLGKGASGQVFLVEHRKLHVKRAVKCIRKDHPFYTRFFKEAHLLKKLQHPGIPVIFDIEEDQDFLYIIEEYVEGISLYSMIKEQGPLCVEQTAAFGLELCEIIRYLHERKPYPVFYLDLKPEHIILCENHVRLIDFGAAVYGRKTKNLDMIFGTEGFSREVDEDWELSETLDVYSIGAVLLFMAAGTCVDIKNGNEWKLFHFPKALEQILENCLDVKSSTHFCAIDPLIQKLRLLDSGAGSVKQKKEPVRIALAGSRAGIGVTCLAVGFMQFLRKKGISSVYHENQSSDFLQSLVKAGADLKEKEGVYRGRDFRAIPFYGESVVEDFSGYSVVIEDFGADTKRLFAHAEEMSFIFLVVGGQPFERMGSERMLTLFDCAQNCGYLLKNVDSAWNFKKYHGNKGRIVGHIPWNIHPLKMTKPMEQLYAKMQQSGLMDGRREKRCIGNLKEKIKSLSGC